MSSNENQYKINHDVMFRTATKLYHLDQTITRRFDRDSSPKNQKDIVAMAVISESHDYFKSCMHAIKGGNLRSAGSLLRSLLESSANVFWIFEDNSNKRAVKYLNTIKTLSDHMDKLLGQMQKPNQRIPLEISKWTTSSAEDRLRSFSPMALMIWDYCSLFTHAQPSLIQYLLESKSGKVPLFIAGQAVVYALTIRLFIADETSLITENEREKLLTMTAEVVAHLV